jgi:hypothetical protein
MNRQRVIALAVAVTVLALASGAKAYTMERVAPSSASVYALESGGTIHLTAGFGGLFWPYIWHAAEWYWDGQLVSTDNSLSGQSCQSRGEFPLSSVGTHTAKVRAKYDSVPFGVDVWTDYLIWTVNVVDPETYTIERVEPASESCSVPVTTSQRFEARFGGIVSAAYWVWARWYMDGQLESTEALSGQTDESFFYPSFTAVGTHTVKVNAQYDLGSIVTTRDLTWTVEVVPHPPTASRVSPGSPVTVLKGSTQAFTARGADPGCESDSLDIAGVRWYLDGVQQSDVGFGQIDSSTIEHAWSHTFDSPGTYEVEAVFYDHEGYSSAGGEAVWTVEVEGHSPSVSRVSPGSPVIAYTGVPVKFTVEGTDPAGDLWRCDVTIDNVFQAHADFSGTSTGSTAAWTHTFDTPGTYQVAFTPFDLANGQGAEVVWTIVVESALKQAGLTGVVVELDAQGRAKGPLTGAKVDLTGPAAATSTTDEQGRFVFTALSPDTYAVNVSKAGYYAQSRAISLAAGETKDEVFRMTPESSEPSAFDFASPRGKHFIEGMPGALSLSVIVAWNGSPGTVRFNVAGTWHTATITDLGAGKAQANLTVAIPTIVSACSELMVEVANGDGERTTLNTGVYLYPIPPIIPTWYANIEPTLDFTEQASFTLWEAEIGDAYSTSAKAGFQKQLSFDPVAGTFSGSISGFGSFDQTLNVNSVELLGEGRMDLSGTLAIALAGCNPPTITPGWSLSLSGKAGVGAPANVVIDILFPPAAPAMSTVRKVPIVKDVINVLKLRLYLIGGGALSGEYKGGQTGSCFLGTTSLSGSLTVGLEGQVALELWGAEAGVYAGGTGTPEFQLCPEFQFEGVTVRAYVGVFASAWLFEFSKEVGVTIQFEPGGQQKVLSIASIPESYSEGDWRPIGDSRLRWGRTNLLVGQGGSGGRLHVLSAQGETSQETRLVENVIPLASPAIVSASSEDLILFCLQDPNKPWYAATDIGTLRQADGQPWALNRIADDQAAEFSPSTIDVESGTTLAAWERVSGDISDANEPGQVAPHLEIVAAWFDPAAGLWSTPQQLTSNAVVDRKPMPIAFGATRGILWIANEGSAATGDANSGDRLMLAEWSGGAWGDPQTLWSAQKGILGSAFVADGLGGGYVVFAVDEDGNLDTTADRELYLLSTANGAWLAAIRLTDDSVEDAMPTLVAPNGVPICVWSADGMLVYSKLRDWNPRPVYSEYTLANEAPSLDGVTMPGGAAIAYTVQGPNGVDIVASFYDAELDCWSLPRQLTNDEHAETALSLACDGNELVMAYLKAQTRRTNMDVEIDGEIHHIENVPQPGRTDLYVLRRVLADDLAVVSQSLVLDPVNPAPGTATTIRATIESRGDLPLQHVEAVFYDGDPSSGGVQIGDRQVISGTLIAGGRRDISVSWTVPAKEVSHEIFIVVDPRMVIEDRDRSNNTLSVLAVLPDLAIETCWSTEVSSTSVALTVRVVNTGVIPAGEFDVSWRLGSPDGQEIGRSTIGSLIDGGAHEATFTWDSGQQAQVFAVADSARCVPESDETNNVSSLAVFRAP